MEAAAPTPKVDTHLVMNALNQLVALNSQPERKEVPLIFLLDDYLHKAMTTLDDAQLPVSHELQRMQAHLKLSSGVSHHAMEVQETRLPLSEMRVDIGAFTEPAAVLFKSLRNLRPCRFQVHMDPEPSRQGDTWLTCSMTMCAGGQASAIDQAAISSRLSRLGLVESGKLRLEAVAATDQRSGAQVTAFFKTRVYEDAAA